LGICGVLILLVRVRKATMEAASGGS